MRTDPNAGATVIIVACVMAAVVAAVMAIARSAERPKPTPEDAATPGAITYSGNTGNVTVFPVTMPDGTKCIAIESTRGAGIDCNHSTRAP